MTFLSSSVTFSTAVSKLWPSVKLLLALTSFTTFVFFCCASSGDGSPSTFWDVSNWKTLYPEYRASGPPYIVADFIQTLLPNSKHLVTFRDPTPR